MVFKPTVRPSTRPAASQSTTGRPDAACSKPARSGCSIGVYEAKLFTAAFMLAFFGFLRVGEIAVPKKELEQQLQLPN
ncbi:hypothetical protein DPMN_027326 [Dreissena polymorpha]|uniref:Uncharacterized protein n=1 Tax=Dreissena polymorpha TaxID=45954 RepID=A0A9D4LU53_DREPO|nr:hypothetical protein DPMN_027326 [Dreissena polymorpha]